jgi:iron complex outermembrane recepter protein
MAKHCLARTLGIGISILGGAMLLQSAVAQEQQPTERVVITGSAIPRTETETPAPVQVISAEEIQKTGATSVNEVLHALTANGEGNLNQAFSGAFAGGAAGVSLRGLTVDATLVLIDGKRMAPYPISDDGQRSFVDVSNLPLSIIDRIEILKDGASALYGSDAIAGVVNIITRKTYTGSEVGADFGDSTHNDGITFHVSATHGWGDLAADGHNTYLNIEYRHQNAIGLDARPAFSNFDYFHEFGPAAPTLPGLVQPGSAIPIVSNLYGMVVPITGTPGTSTAAVGTTGTQLAGCPKLDPTLQGCGYNIAQYYQVQPDTENLNLWLRHTMDLTPGWQAAFTASMFNSKAEQLNPPTSVGPPVGAWPSLNNGTINTNDPQAQPIVLPAHNKNNPLGVPVMLAYAFGDLGGPLLRTDTSMYRLAADLNGNVLGWDLNTSVGYIRGISQLSYTGFPSYSGLLSVIADNSYGIGALASTNSAATLERLAPTTQGTATSGREYFEFAGTRDVFALWGGPLSVSLGGSLHHWGQDAPGQPGSIQGNIIGFGTTRIQGTETDQAVHAELVAPVLKWVEADGQVRFDKVNGVGTAISPKGGFKVTPIPQIAIRGTYGRGFRAPGPGERGPNSAVTFFSAIGADSARCPTTGLPSDCGSASAAAEVRGSGGLSPEKSETYTLGLVLEPIKAVSISADWYKIRRKDGIISDFSSAVFIRGPVQAAFPTLPGPIVALVAPYKNLGLDDTSGLEFDFQAKHDFAPIGVFSIHGTWTHLIQDLYCPSPNLDSCVEVAGTHGPTGISGNTATPKDRGQAILALDRGPYEAGFTLNYVSGYSLADPTIGAFGLNQPGGCLNPWYTSCRIASYTDVDLFGSYSLSKAFSVTGHILNVFDRDAPFDPQANYGEKNYNSAFAQQGAVGRFFEVGFKYLF